MAGDAEDIRSRSAWQPGRPERDAADAVPGCEESGCRAAATYPVAAVTRRAAACARWGCSCGCGVPGGGQARVMAHGGSESAGVGYGQGQAGVAEQAERVDAGHGFA